MQRWRVMMMNAAAASATAAVIMVMQHGWILPDLSSYHIDLTQMDDVVMKDDDDDEIVASEPPRPFGSDASSFYSE
jgi:hypothetical protein